MIIIIINILGTSHIICIVLQCGGDHQWFKCHGDKVCDKRKHDDDDNNNNIQVSIN
jgi:hypothetical protein